MGDFNGERAGIDQFVAVGQQAGERATGDVAEDVSAGSLGAETDGGERFDDLGEVFDGEPMELNVLPRRDVAEIARILLGQVADDAQLVRGEQAVGQANAHHEVLGCFAYAVLAAGDAEAVALGVDAPPLEVEFGPLGQDGGAAFAGELADFLPGVPWVLGQLQPLGLLGLGFLGGGCGVR